MKKRILSLLLALVMLFSLSGCSMIPAFVMGMLNAQNEMAEYENMTLAEAEKLDDFDLCTTVLFRVDAEDEAEFATLSHPQQVMSTVLWYQAEMDNGGLCQYLFNLGYLTAPSLLDALDEIGAEAYHDQLAEFVTENGIALDHFEGFDVDEEEFSDWKEMEAVYDAAYEELEGKYPFDDFDEAFYGLEDKNPLEPYCAAYIRDHMTDFFDE